MHADPDLIVIFAGSILAIVGYNLSRAFARRVERSRAPLDLEPVLQRLDQLERGIDALSMEMERNSESHRFIAKLLSELEHQPAQDRLPGA